MKKILVVYTGGTICSFSSTYSRVLDVDKAKRTIIHNFSQSASKYAHLSKDLFLDSELLTTTLSENMTLFKLNKILENIKSFCLEDFLGVIVLHGTDTLSYTSALLSLVFHNAKVPIMMVSANRPPDDEKSNANINFKTAVELIINGIAPNVYVPYQNSDNHVWLHLGSTLMQCENFSDDFKSATNAHVFLADSTDRENPLFSECDTFSKNRFSHLSCNLKALQGNILCIKPYVGIDYSLINLNKVKAVIHTTYHSGTVCVERNSPLEEFSENSILYLSKKCQSQGIPLFIVPCKLSSEQYSSIYDAVTNGNITPLNMTLESAFAKLLLYFSGAYPKTTLHEFLNIDINNELIK